MVDLIRGLDPQRVAANVASARERIARAAERAGRDPAGVELLAAVKYLAGDELPVLAGAGVRVAGENRAQALAAKVAAHGNLFTWDFIGHLQSRKVKDVLPLVRYIHSVSSDSVLEQLGRHGDAGTRVLVEVNVAGEQGKSGIAPDQLGAFLARCPVRVIGLMTMPPLASSPAQSRPWFAALARLAREHGLPELSMGTSQDFEAAVEEGATIVRLGSSLYH